MSLSGQPRRPVAAGLLRHETPPKGPRVVRVRMLRHGHGITSHGRRPLEIKPKEGDVLEVSSDLADNWTGATPPFCEPFPDIAVEKEDQGKQENLRRGLADAMEPEEGSETSGRDKIGRKKVRGKRR